jgi:hypothetical protein
LARQKMLDLKIKKTVSDLKIVLKSIRNKKNLYTRSDNRQIRVRVRVVVVSRPSDLRSCPSTANPIPEPRTRPFRIAAALGICGGITIEQFFQVPHAHRTRAHMPCRGSCQIKP